MPRVLIVEDEPSTGALLSQLVQRLWPQAVVAIESDGLSAIEYWKNNDIDLVLLDWGLPGVPGIEVLKQIRRHGRKTRCVIVSGRADREGILDARNYHVDAYIVKPFNAKQVMVRLSTLMAVSNEATPDVVCDSLENFIEHHLTHELLRLPLTATLVDAIERIRELGASERVKILRQCQTEPALVLRTLSLANSSQYLKGMDVIETFERSLQHIGLDVFINLAVESSLYPGTNLKQDFLRASYREYQRDCLALAEIVTRLGADVEFDVSAARTACMLCRIGELSLLRLMQIWLDQGQDLDETTAASILDTYSARAGNRIKIQRNIPSVIRGRIGAVYLLPPGTVKKDPVVMRIAGLLHTEDRNQELPRLLARVGLTGSKAETYLRFGQDG